MIGRLRGHLLHVADNTALLEVAGVGYEVEVLAAALSRHNATEELTLHTHLVVREDAQLLFGFLQKVERDLFRNLIRITGVGPKMAMAILVTFSGGELARCVLQNDLVALTQVPGVGRKTAERLLVELRNRQELLPQDSSPVTTLIPRDVTSEVEQALVALGYKHQYAHEVVTQLLTSRGWDSADVPDTQSMLRAALQFLGQKSEVGQ